MYEDYNINMYTAKCHTHTHTHTHIVMVNNTGFTNAIKGIT